MRGIELPEHVALPGGEHNHELCQAMHAITAPAEEPCPVCGELVMPEPSGTGATIYCRGGQARGPGGKALIERMQGRAHQVRYDPADEVHETGLEL